MRLVFSVNLIRSKDIVIVGVSSVIILFFEMVFSVLNDDGVLVF